MTSEALTHGWGPRAARAGAGSQAALASGVLAAVLCVLDLLLRPADGKDVAAQTARATFAAEHPFTPLDLSWFRGLPAPGYSVLSPPVMALLGVSLTGVLAAAASAALLTRLLLPPAGTTAGAGAGAGAGWRRWPLAVAGVVSLCVAADVASGRTTYALAVVPAVAAVLLRRRWPAAAVLAVLTALTSPVAAVGLGMAAAGMVVHRIRGGWTIGVAATAATLALSALFSVRGVEPAPWDTALPGAAVALAVAALTHVRVVRTVALLDAVVILLLPLHHDPFGENVLRLGVLLAAPVMLATTRRAAPVAAVAALALLAWQTDSTRDDLRAPVPPSTVALAAELVAVSSFRAEVVPLVAHEEAAGVIGSVPIARGWNRQVDLVDNPLFYAGTLTGPTYLAWLASRGVDHVAVPLHAAVDVGGTRELALLAGAVPGLTQVWADADWAVLAVDDPTPLADLPLQVVSSGRATLVLVADAPATAHVRLRWSRWLSLSGPGCLRRVGDEVEVVATGAGPLVVGSSLRPAGHC